MLWSAKQLGLSTAEFKRRRQRAMWRPSELPEAVRDAAGWGWAHQAADRAIRRARWLLWLPILVQGFVGPTGGRAAVNALLGHPDAPGAGLVAASAAWMAVLLLGCALSLVGAGAIGMTLEFGHRSLVRVAWLGALGAGVACACAALAGLMELLPGWPLTPTTSTISLEFCAGVAAVDALAVGATLYALLRHGPALADIDHAIAAHSPLPAR